MLTRITRRFLPVMLLAVLLTPAVLPATPALATASFVNHGGNIVPSAPTAATPVDFWVQIGYQFYITDVRLYYTTDGSEPVIDPATHQPRPGTSFVNMQWDHDEPAGEQVALWYKATLGPWPTGTVVRYKIAAWHSGGGETLYADSSVDWPITDAGQARIFGFRVGENQLPSWIGEAVIYNVFVDRFFDGDTSNNLYCARGDDDYCDRARPVHLPNNPEEHHPQDEYRYTYNGGDLDGVIEKLDYLHRLGINVLWLSPVFENNHVYVDSNYNFDEDIFFTYHGYHPRDPLAVDEVFGSQADLQALVDQAQDLGIRVILDFVPNHTSNQHPYFVDASTRCAASPYYDWYTFQSCNTTADPSFNVAFPQSYGQAAETYTSYGSQDTYKTFFGVRELPQINNDNPQARDYTIGQAVHWLDTLGLAGYRLDYAPGPSTDFWRAFDDVVGDEETFTIAEIWLDNGPEVIRRQQGRVDAAMDFEANAAMVSFLTNASNVDNLSTALHDRAGYYYQGGIEPDEFVRGCFIDNHDMDRLALRTGYNTSTLKVGALLMFTQPCVPVMYYGDEVGLGQEFTMYAWDTDGRDGPEGRPEYARERMPWGTAADVPADWQGVQNRALLDFYYRLIPMRKQVAALQTFSPESFTDVYRHEDDRTYAYLRGNGVDQVLVALNASGVRRTLDLPNLDSPLPYPAGTVLVDLLGSGVSCTVANGRCSFALSANNPGVILAPEVDVEVTRAGNRVLSAATGQTVSYEFVVRNTNDMFSAHDVAASHFLVDTYDRFLWLEGTPGLEVLRDVSISDPACELAYGAVECSWGDLGPGESRTITIQGTVSYCYRTKYRTVTVFGFTVAYSSTDPNPDNSWDDKVIRVTGNRCPILLAPVLLPTVVPFVPTTPATPIPVPVIPN